jgi:hypothetical protein
MSKEIHKDGKLIGNIETGIDGKQLAKDTRHRSLSQDRRRNGPMTMIPS